MLARAFGVKSISTSMFLISFLARSVSMSVLNLAMLGDATTEEHFPLEVKLNNRVTFAHLWQRVVICGAKNSHWKIQRSLSNLTAVELGIRSVRIA